MKKTVPILLAFVPLLLSPAPARADVTLGLGGHFKGYVAALAQDEVSGADARSFDILRESEVHFSGEAKLDSGLTVGAHIEADMDRGESFAIDESYVYFQNEFGALNFGAEGGAAYLLQVAAPSADSNVDGMRQYINPVNYAALFGGGAPAALTLDYANNFSRNHDKITYITPLFGGLQGGLSYSPEAERTTGFNNNLDDEPGDFGDVWEAGLRYEGKIDAVEIILGAGYLQAGLEQDDPAGFDDDMRQGNVAFTIAWQGFGVGMAYQGDNGGLADDGDTRKIVAGAEYKQGAYKFGVSYMNADIEEGASLTGTVLDIDRYSAGVSYKYGPGLSLRGSVAYVEHETPVTTRNASYMLLGTQIEF